MVRPRRSRLALVAGALIVVVSIAFALRKDHGRTVAVPTVPAPKGVKPLADPYAWAPDRSADFSRRAAAGTAGALYELSPGGVAVSAARVARFRPQIERAAKAAGVRADRLEGLVFLESAGRPDATAGGVQSAAGLTQILAETGQDLLGMKIDTARSASYTRRIARAAGARRVAALERARARVDERFDPGKALAATARYLAMAKNKFGREDLAFVSYHMGMGNLDGVLKAYGKGPVPYAQLYFDSTPLRHAAAYAKLSGFGDDSSNYFWKIGAAEAIMRLMRTDPARLARQSALLEAPAPPAADGDLVAVRSASGMRFPPGARLRSEAAALALYAGALVKTISGAPSLNVTGTAGGRLDVSRRYASPAQAVAFQYVLDRLRVLGAIQWWRDARSIHITVSKDAARLEPLLKR
ncbi:transglycosylase SLT domain-containing protein [Candidatus Solirubrobacter pratensis]|uniref:transglycosylase SLT domain-containing protein n=1 Tax=Candidatus Solirubrobacter pratensis TaxID=1298857 RepID=UPI0003FAD7C4|nr:transglycosylase SLT domain-containing protein [Candidatus Solirubrobacter pratensis]